MPADFSQDAICREVLVWHHVTTTLAPAAAIALRRRRSIAG